MPTKIFYLIAFICLLLAGYTTENPKVLPRDHSVALLLETLGDQPMPHKANTQLPGVSIQRGKELVINGRSRTGGITSKRQSRYFTCIACHNIKREDPDLANPDPQQRLLYVQEKSMPYLQGSPLYGVVNRSSFYNGDYEKKYGDLVDAARKDLRNAIQLCAVECSQGRKLEDFELESVLAYLWTIDLKLNDLNLTTAEFELIEDAFNRGSNQKRAIEIIKSKYLDHSPATFVAPPTDRNSGGNYVGDPKNGKLIYALSCQHCHYDHDFAFLTLNNEQLTFEHLARKAPTYQPESIYQVIRYGTQPKGGKRGYMPQYTLEKMTDKQLADLRAYIDQQAGQGPL